MKETAEKLVSQMQVIEVRSEDRDLQVIGSKPVHEVLEETSYTPFASEVREIQPDRESLQ